MIDASPPDRLAGLDSWRAALMVGGPFVHGSIWLDPQPLFLWIIYLSSGTRMGAFFAIAGFLAGRSLSRQSTRRWFERRIAQLLPPTLFGLAVICPLIGVLHYLRYGDVAAFRSESIKLHHLWFLVALCLYTGLAVAIAPAILRLQRLGAPSIEKVTATAILVGLLMATILSMDALPTAAMHPGIVWQERRMLLHAPVFLMGLTLGFRDDAPWRRPGAGALPLLLLCLTFAWPWLVGGMLAHAIGQETVDAIYDIVRMTVSPPAAAILVLRSADAIRRVPALVERMAAASLTLYILHLPLILAMHLALRPWPLDPHVRYAAAIGASIFLSYQLHHRLIVRSRWLRFAINGASPRLLTAVPVNAAVRG